MKVLRSWAFKITLTYLIAGLLWITFSDYLLVYIYELLNITQENLNHLATWKGYFYIVTTSLLLFIFIRKSLLNETQVRSQYAQYFENNPNPFVIYLEKTGEILQVNQAAVEVYGFNSTEIKSKKWNDIEKDSGISDYTKRGIFLHQYANGQVQYHRVHSHKVVFQGRNCIFSLSVLVQNQIVAELTNQKLFNEVKDKNNLLKLLLDSPKNYMILQINTKGDIKYANSAFKQIKTHETNNFFELLDENDKEELKAIIRTIENNQNSVHSLKTIFNLNLNNEKRIFWDFFSIHNAGSLSIQCIGHDVSERDAYMTQVSDYAKQIADILNSISDGFFAVDEEWNFTYVNQTFETILGEKKSDLVGKNIWVYFSETLKKEFEPHYKEVVDTGKNKLFIYYSEENEIWYEVATYPFKNGISVFFRDISQLKKQEQNIIKQNTKLKHIAWTQAHDLRAPLSNILGLIEIIEDNCDSTEEIKHYLKSLNKTAHELDALLQNIIKQASQE